jgi:hypothetical protein
MNVTRKLPSASATSTGSLAVRSSGAKIGVIGVHSPASPTGSAEVVTPMWERA